MEKKRTLFFLSTSAILTFTIIVLVQNLVPAQETPAPRPGETPYQVFKLKGEAYGVFRDGNVYRGGGGAEGWTFVLRLFEPGYRDKNYVEEGGVLYRKDPESGKRYRVRKKFADSFEDAKGLKGLIGIDRGWTAFTLQSPSTPTVQDYVRLRKSIIKGTGTFIDNRIVVTRGRARSGEASLAFHCKPPARDMVCSKTSLSTELLHFTKGDHVWFSAWYFIDRGTPFTLADLETTWLHQHPGIRITLWGGKHLGMELKWADKPAYRQVRGKELVFPRGRWVHVRFHLVLSDQQDGLVEVWQDQRRVIRQAGRTLPLPEVIYNNLEVGISALCHDSDAVLYVDDVVIASEKVE